jgi:hypothetical protein
MPLVSDQKPPVAFGSRQGPLIALQVLFVLIALIIYLLRLYTRVHVLRSTGTDDYVMGIAMVCPALALFLFTTPNPITAKLTCHSKSSSSASLWQLMHASAQTTVGEHTWMKSLRQTFRQFSSASGCLNYFLPSPPPSSRYLSYSSIYELLSPQPIVKSYMEVSPLFQHGR